MSKLAIEAIKALQPYQAGKPVEELERELGITSAIKLASNENPWGCSPLVKNVLVQSLTNLSLYPDANAFYLKQALAKKLNVNNNQITIGNGSNDVLDLLARTFLSVGDEAIFSEYAFLVYPIVVQAVGATARVSKALPEGTKQAFGHDLEAMLALINAKTKIIFIANPNNPTGTYFSKTALDAFLAQVPSTIIVVIDEAYFEYVDKTDYPNGLDYLPSYDNVVVTRTFSKIHGLAALRVGYAVSHPSVSDVLNRVRQPFNGNSLGLLAAQTSLDDDQFVTDCQTNNNQALADFYAYLDEHDYGYMASVANFVTVRFGEKSMDIYQQLLQKGIIVRPVANYALTEYLRLSMGTKEQMSALTKALDELRVQQ